MTAANPIPFDAAAHWSEPDMSVLAPVRPPAPVMSDSDLAAVFGPWSEWLKSAAIAKGAPVDYVAMALLTTASAALGNSRWVSPWAGWEEPPVLWAMAVGEPSSGKSPALDAVLDPVREIERGYAETYKAKREEWSDKDEIARLALAQWKSEAKSAIADGDEAPEKPDAADAGAPPVRDRIRISDATTEKVAELLSFTWRGLLLSRDELAGWLGGMDRYNGGGDRPFWLEAYGGRAYTIDRKSSPEPIVVDHLSVAVLGGTQPDKLNSLLVKTDDDGMLSRFMTVFPEPMDIARPRSAIDSGKLEMALRRLREIQPAMDDAGNRRPFLVYLTERAADAFDEFRRECRNWEKDATGLFKGHIGKMPGIALRLSCVLAHLDWAASEGADYVGGIDEGHIGRACHLAGEHLRHHAYRAYGTAKPPQEIVGAQAIAEIIRTERPERLKVRDIQHRGRAGLTKAAQVKAALAVLVEANWLAEVKTSTGGNSGGRPEVFYPVNPRLEGAQ